VFVDDAVNQFERNRVLSTTSSITSGSSVEAAAEDSALLMENQSAGNTAMAIHCVSKMYLHCVQNKTPTHIFFHISMCDV